MLSQEYVFLKNTTYLKIVFASILCFTAMNLLLPVIPVFFAKQGMDNAQIGILTGVYAFGIFLVRMFAGRIFDFCGGFLLAKLSLIALMFFSFVYLFQWDFQIWFIFRLLHGIMVGVYFAIVIPQVSLIADHLQNKKCLPAFYFLNGFGFIFGNMLGSFLFMDTFKMTHIIAFKEFFLLSSLLLLKREVWQKNIVKTNVLKLSQVFKQKVVYKTAVLLFMTTFVGSAIFTFLPLHAYELGAKKELVTFFTVYSVFVVVARFTLTCLNKQIGTEKWLNNFLLLLVVLFVLLSLIKTNSIFLIVGILAGFLGGIFMPLASLLLSAKTNYAVRGTAFVSVVAFTELGSFLGNVFAGFWIKNMGFMTAYLGLAFFCFLLWLWCVWQREKEEKIVLKI